MFPRGLKTKIAVNITILLLLGMLSINLVTMMTAKRDLIRAEVTKAFFFMAVIDEFLMESALWERIDANLQSKGKIIERIDESGISCLMIIGRNGKQLTFGMDRFISQDELVRHTREAMASGKKTVNFTGISYSFFGKQEKGVIVSAPLSKNGVKEAGYSIVLPLDEVYETLKRSQRILFLYIFVNTAILAFLGIYRVFKLYLMPVSRLAQRAEEYREDDDGLIFSVRKEDNELNRLSNALNSMLRRISADKEKLKLTVSSLEKANIELKKAQQEIISAEKLASVGRLSAGVAHEIGNPIGIVAGYLELLKQPDITAAERSEYLKRSEKEIERINTIIRQLLDVSRPSKTGIEKVSVHELLDDTAAVLDVQPLMSNIVCARNLMADNDSIMADPNLLRQVFLNLIINAADAISSVGKEHKGHLEINTEIKEASILPSEPSQQIVIEFIDNGPGISEENIDKIFDPFYTTKDPGKGTGLGLSVSFMIIERFGGRIAVASPPGNGTIMTIRLPLVD